MCLSVSMINQKKILVNVYGVGTNLLKFAPYHLPGLQPGEEGFQAAYVFYATANSSIKSIKSNQIYLPNATQRHTE